MRISKARCGAGLVDRLELPCVIPGASFAMFFAHPRASSLDATDAPFVVSGLAADCVCFVSPVVSPKEFAGSHFLFTDFLRCFRRTRAVQPSLASISIER